MKQSISSFLQSIQYIYRPFRYWLAPVLLLLGTIGAVYLATQVILPEKLQAYEAFFLIIAFLVTAFFLLICLPCAAYSAYLSVMNMVREKHYVLPALQLLLNAGLIAAWIMALQRFIL